MLQLPPAGAAVNALVSVSQIAAVVVVLLAVPENGLTVKVTSDSVCAQLPLAATVYLMVTFVSAAISAGV
ncbi:hypothetical protein D3C72_2504840 [compost metagenome]